MRQTRVPRFGPLLVAGLVSLAGVTGAGAAGAASAGATVVGAMPAGAASAGAGPAAVRHVDLELVVTGTAPLPTEATRDQALSTVRALGLRVDDAGPTALRVSGPARLVDDVFPVEAGVNGGHPLLGGVLAVPVALVGTVTAATDADDRTPVARAHLAYPASDLVSAYGGAAPGGYPHVRPALTAASPVIATVELTGLDPLPVTTYAQQVAFAADPGYDPVTMPAGAPQISAVGVDRTTAYDPGRDTDGSSAEFAADEEVLLDAAPQARQRAYVATNTAAGIFNAYNAVLADVARGLPIVAMSTSWGSCEAVYNPQYVAQVENVLQRLTDAGVTVFAASGDDGLRDCAPIGRFGPAVDFPASSPVVVGVGGTTHSGGSSVPDTAWTGPDPAAGSGGGVSALFARPGYQALVGSGDKRQVPDIALDADVRTGFAAYLPDHGGGTSSVDGPVAVGGTSLAAPLAAASLTNVELAHGGPTRGLGDIHRSLYLARRLPGSITDITAVADNHLGTINPPARGYDRSTGLGTPDFAALAPLLYGGTPGPTAAPTVSLPNSPVSATTQARFRAAAGVTATAFYLWPAGADHGCTGRPYAASDRLRGLPLGHQRLVVHSVDSDLLCSAGRTVSTDVGLDDRVAARSGGWVASHNGAAFSATYLQSSQVGATVSWPAVGGRVYDLLLDRVKGVATVAVSIDGRVVRTIRLSAAKPAWQQRTTVTAARHGTHRVGLRVLIGTVRVDGLLLH